MEDATLPSGPASALGQAPFRVLADKLPALCFVADPDGSVAWCNARWHAYTGVDPGEALLAAWVRHTPRDFVPEAAARWQATVAAAARDEMTLWLEGADGVARPFLTRVEPLWDESGRLTGWLGAMTDVSEQQEIERNQRFLLELGDALREEDDAEVILHVVGQRLAEHLKATRVGYGELLPDGESVVAGALGWTDWTMPGHAGVFPLSSFGEGPAGAVRRGEVSVIHDVETDPTVGEGVAAHLAVGARACITAPLIKHGRLAALLYVHASTRRTWRHGEVQLVREVAERTWATLERARAEAERRVTEAHLRASEARFRGLFETAHEGIWQTDGKGRTQFANRRMAEMLGFPVEHLMARPIAEFVFPEDAVMARLRVGETLTGKATQFEFRFRRHDGSALPVLASTSPLLDGDGRVMGAVGMFSDLTERREVEAELQRSREALHQSEKINALGSLLAGISHELNNPLSVVLTQAKLLEMGAAGTVLAERASRIHAAAERCARIVQNFLAVARQKAPVRTEIAPGELVRSALEFTAYGLRSAGVELSVETPDSLPALVGDADQLAQVLVNLIINAEHALQERPQPRRLAIIGRTDAARERVRIVVEDNGPGVPADARRRIFEPFFTTKPQGVGTGIGLSFSLGVVEAHGGTLTLEQAPGAGARFVIDLPVASIPAPAPKPTPPPPVPTEKDGPATVLVIDDEADLREVLGELLEHEGYRVDQAGSGAEAQSKLRDGDYALVISDLRMHDLDGPALFGWLESERPDLIARTAFITGDVLGGAAARFLAQAGRPVLEKPFHPDGLRAFLAKLNDGSRPESEG